MVLSQANRLLSLGTPLGEDTLLLTAFSGSEEISRLFEYQLEMISDDPAIQAPDIVGKNVTFSVEVKKGERRYFNGFVNQFAAGNEEDGRRNYRAHVVPWLWFLTQTTDCRIYQEKSVPEMIEQILGEMGFSDFEMNLSMDHAPREYTVQYRESDYDFLARLMEEEGMFYYFVHDDGVHTLHIADNKNAYYGLDESEVDFPAVHQPGAITDHLTSWEHRYEFRPGKWTHTDYDFKKPSTKLEVEASTVVPISEMSKYEIYDNPGKYVEKSNGTSWINVRMEEEEAQHDVVNATSTCKTFSPGGKFSIGRHRSSSEEGKSYLVTSISHSAEEPFAYETGSGGNVESDYSNLFTCIPDSVSFRANRTTRKPVMSGVQTAVVVGPAGEEIHVDEYGRVKVQFFWDREGKKDENSSCWIRVSQNWAGQNWGMFHHPRINQEVIIDFVEGDPDRPIIIGRVHNAEQMPPYELPANKTMSGIKTRSSLGGSTDNFNEIRFEDSIGNEQLFIHAEKNQDIEVENDETHWVGNDREKTIERDEKTDVKRNRTEAVGKNEEISIGDNRTETVGKNESVSVGKDRTLSVEKNEKIDVGENRTLNVGKDESISIGKDQNRDVGKNESVKIGENAERNVGKNEEIVVGKSFALIAGDQIQLQTGSASLILKKNGDIELKGKNIKITGSGKISVKASGKVTVKGSKVDNN